MFIAAVSYIEITLEMKDSLREKYSKLASDANTQEATKLCIHSSFRPYTRSRWNKYADMALKVLYKKNGLVDLVKDMIFDGTIQLFAKHCL